MFRVTAYGTGCDHESPAQIDWWHLHSERDMITTVREQIRAGAILVTIHVEGEKAT